MLDRDGDSKFYTYQRLKHSDSIRLLELLPGNTQDALRISLSHTRKSNNLVYEALSYTWGDATLVTQVYDVSSDSIIKITENLGAAMRDLRHVTETRTIWIDAICIDQNNPSERGHQVALMGDIFRSAKQVVVWLGPCGDGTTSELDVVHALHEIERKAQDSYSNLFREEDGLTPLGLELGHCLEERALYDFVSRSWFERVWTVQEFVLAKAIKLCVGRFDIPLETFYAAVSLLSFVFDIHAPADLAQAMYPRNLPTGLRTYQQRIAHMGTLVYLRRDHERGILRSQLLWNSVMNLARYRQCADPRDRVYGMLGLGENSKIIVPNYEPTYTYEQVCLDFATHCLLRHNLYLLHDCGRSDVHISSISKGPVTTESFERSVATATTPSFVPDIAYDATIHSVLAFADKSACTAAGQQFRSKVELVDRVSVSITGVAVDVITNVFPFTEPPTEWNFKGPDLSRDELSWGPLISHLTRHAPEFRKQLSWLTKKEVLRPDAATHNSHEIAFSKEIVQQGSYMSSVLIEADPLRSDADTLPSEELFYWVIFAFDAHRIYTTKLGYLGVGTKELKEGDQVVIFDGGDTPFILRQASEVTGTGEKRWKLVGDAYVLGWMDGNYFGHEVVDEVDMLPHMDGDRGSGTKEYGDKASEAAAPRRLARTSYILC